MTAMFDFDRLLCSVLEDDGPRELPAGYVDGALARARGVGQRRPLVGALDRRAWPARRSLTASTSPRVLALGLMALLVLAFVTALFVGGRVVRPSRPDILGSFDGVIETIGRLSETREEPALVALDDGRVLIVGGAPGVPAVVVDPGTGRTAPVGTDGPDGPITAVRLRDGRVLVFGWTYAEPAVNGRPDIRLFDPATDTFVPAGPMVAPRFEPTVTLLADGRVLVSGGVVNPEAGPVRTAELFEPATNAFAPSDWEGWRFEATTVQLDDGRILEAGGSVLSGDPSSSVVYSVELAVLDPVNGRWTEAGSLSHKHWSTDAIRLDDGRVLLFNASSRPDVAHFGRHGIEPVAVDIFDPKTNTVSSGFPLPHTISIAAPLSDGRIFMAGHWDVLDCVLKGSCEGRSLDAKVEDWWIGLYDPRTGETITSRDPLGGGSNLISDIHVMHANAAVLPDDRVLMVTGKDIEIFH